MYQSDEQAPLRSIQAAFPICAKVVNRMHEYDTVLKDLLTSPQNSIFERITGAKIYNWLNVEFPEVQQTRVDMLGETAGSKRLIAVELQSANDPNLPLRMAEYALRAYRAYRRFPEQYVLYVGNAALRMPPELKGPKFHCRYEITDIRDIEEEDLLSSPFAVDNVLAILARHKDRLETVRRILARIAKLEGSSRDSAFRKLMILAGLRKLDDSVRKEATHMPILDDIMDHGVIGPAIRQGLEKGREEGRHEGVQLGELVIIRRLLNKRFGPLPAWANENLAKLSAAELEDLSVRVLDVASLEELFNA